MEVAGRGGASIRDYGSKSSFYGVMQQAGQCLPRERGQLCSKNRAQYPPPPKSDA